MCTGDVSCECACVEALRHDQLHGRPPLSRSCDYVASRASLHFSFFPSFFLSFFHFFFFSLAMRLKDFLKMMR